MDNIYKHKIAFFIAIVMFFNAYAQDDFDIIYQNNDEQIKCLLIEVTADKVKYQPIDNLDGPVYNIYRSDVALIFKRDGSFFIPQNMNAQWIEGANSEVNKIITNKSQIISSSLIEISGDTINYLDTKSGENKTLSTQEVVAIIYKDGRHNLLSDPKEIAPVLDSLAPNINTFSNLEVNKFLEIDDVDVQEYQFKALKRTEDLGNYLKIITNKEEDEMDQLDAIELACLLFINSGDSSWVEVSSLNRPEKRQYLIREYLNRIRLLRYDRVELSWTDISYVSKLRKGEDGNYYGVITFQQLFRGFIDGKIEYQDVTQKDIEVVLTTYEKQVRGMTILHWDVFLSNIGVQETKEK